MNAAMSDCSCVHVLMKFLVSLLLLDRWGSLFFWRQYVFLATSLPEVVFLEVFAALHFLFGFPDNVIWLTFLQKSQYYIPQVLSVE